MARQLQRDQLRMRGLARSLEAVSPLATVARGYSILTRVEDGALVRSADQVTVGDSLQARLSEGTLQLRVEKTQG
jgi:exodeoxyribonuclease VII large subunit